MICLTRPNAAALDRYLEARQQVTVFTNDREIPNPPPDGFGRNHFRGNLGSGEHMFHAARTALTDWRQFPGGWIDVFPSSCSVHQGQTVAVIARCCGLWSVNACRVIDLSESDEDDLARFSMTYATLSDHMLAGAERFCVEWNKTDDRVTYDLSSYARPQHWLAHAVYPVIRRLQRRFAVESHAAMQEYIARSPAVT